MPVTLAGHAYQVSVVAVAPDGSWLVNGNDGGMSLIWDVATGRLLHVLNENDVYWVTSIAITRDGKWLAATSTDKTVRIIYSAAGRLKPP